MAGVVLTLSGGLNFLGVRGWSEDLLQVHLGLAILQDVLLVVFLEVKWELFISLSIAL